MTTQTMDERAALRTMLAELDALLLTEYSVDGEMEDALAVASERLLPRFADAVRTMLDDAAQEEPLAELATEINAINRANGWRVLTAEDWPSANGDESKVLRIGTALALIHSEASEALEGMRKYDRANFEEELADVLIRVLDVAGGLGVDIDTAVHAKLERNRQRGHRHGGKAV